MAKTVFFVNFHFLASRNLLTSDVRSYLEKNPELLVLMFVPDYKLEFFQKEYGHCGFEIIGLNETQIKAPKVQNFFRWLCYHLIPTKAMYNRLGYVYHEAPTFRNWIELGVNQIFSKTLAQLKWLKLLVRTLDLSFSHNELVANLFIKYRPDKVFVTDIFHEVDVAFSLEAYRQVVPTVAMVRSWDNPTTKSFLRGKYESIIVNNNFIRDELHNYHYYPKEQVFVGGTPQFDLSYQGFATSREGFYRRIGAPKDKRIILFAGSGYLLSRSDLEFCELLKEGFKTGHIPKDCIILVRAHPSSTEFLEQFQPDENFILDCPGYEFKMKKRSPELTVSDQLHLLESIKYSSVLVYVHTTLAIDALPFDIPQVILCFDGLTKKAKWHHPMLYHNEDHFKRFLDSDASKKVFSREEMFQWINTYLENPTLDREKRRLAALEQIFSTDGQAGHHIGKFLLKSFGVNNYDRNYAGETCTQVQQ